MKKKTYAVKFVEAGKVREQTVVSKSRKSVLTGMLSNMKQVISCVAL